MRVTFRSWRPRITIKVLIVVLSMLCVVIVTGSLLVMSFYLSRNVLMQDAQNYNAAYAKKQADSISQFVGATERRMAFSATVIASDFDNPSTRDREVQRLKRQDDSFNSVVLVDHSGVVIATDPDLGLLGNVLTSSNHQLMQARREPLLSQPFVATSGRLTVSLSQPIWDEQAKYLGYLTGTIYLQEPNVLGRMLAEHYYRDGSQVYVVDGQACQSPGMPL